MNVAARQTALFQICERGTKLRSWTDRYSDDHVPLRFKEIKMQKDNLCRQASTHSTTDSWDFQICQGSQLMKGKHCRVLVPMQNDAE